MQYELPVESYAGKIREVVIGQGEKSFKVGGENTLPFHFFEGSLPNTSRFALEVYDMVPKGWAEGVLEYLKDVISDPVEWAKKCAGDFGADAICLQLLSTDPGEKDTSPEEAAQLTKRVIEAAHIPVIVYGSGDEKKDVAVLQKVAEVCAGENLLLGPVVKENYGEIVQAAAEHGHGIIAQSPLDINLMKELNVKVSKAFPPEKIVIDPLSPALGYGLEYGFSIMERAKQAAVIHKDAMLQMPIIANIGGDCWKSKEAKADKGQGILWEAITALSLLLAGANILILRHPETLKLVREMI